MLDMGTYRPIAPTMHTATPTPAAAAAAAHALSRPSQLTPCATSAVLLNGVPPVARSASATGAAPTPGRTPRWTLAAAAAATAAAAEGGAEGSVTGPLHLLQVLPQPLVGRALVFGNTLALKLDDEWQMVERPYFSAPGGWVGR